jgi:hypothetical protein
MKLVKNEIVVELVKVAWKTKGTGLSASDLRLI